MVQDMSYHVFFLSKIHKNVNEPTTTEAKEILKVFEIAKSQFKLIQFFFNTSSQNKDIF